MERGLVARKHPLKRRPWIPAIAVLAAVLLGATSTYAWDTMLGEGTTENARRVAWHGDASARLQAIEALFSEARGNIDVLVSIEQSGHEPEAQQARLALLHLRNRLKN